MTSIKTPKKLIEVALPLDDINAAATREKSIRHGHPSTLHLWWARRPLAAARAVIFAQMVNDPSETIEGDRRLRETKIKIQNERERLFDIIRELVKWENTTNEEVLNKARLEIKKSWEFTCKLNAKHPDAAELFNPERLPAFHDPFAGGGAIPLEAQRLGLESYASDLNPVAVMINKAMIEIPPKFAGQKPVGPLPEGEKDQDLLKDYSGAKGLAEDVRRYGYWMKQEAEKRIGHLYPKVTITKEMTQEREDLIPYLGQELTVIAWLWARTVKSPNPAFNDIEVPLVRSFVLSSKKGHEAWVEPVIKDNNYEFVVRSGKKPKDALDGTVVRSGGTCIISKTAMPFTYIREEGKAGRLGQKLMAIVAEGPKGRIYLPANSYKEDKFIQEWSPATPLHGKCRVNVSNYGINTFADLFNNRQLYALNTFSALISEAHQKVYNDALNFGMVNDSISLEKGGQNATAYADALSIYLSFGINRLADRCSTICSWDAGYNKIRNTFGRQAIPMTWDYCEGNIFSDSTGNFLGLLSWVYKYLINALNTPGFATQNDAQIQNLSNAKVISTDPPYYDNISYADLSDYFYVWMRHNLKNVYPSLFSTMAVPKSEELVATPYRHGSKENAEKFFLDGMTKAMQQLSQQSHPAFPVSIYYAFKQSETKADSTSSTGWETFLEAVIRSGFSIDGTWPMRTEMANRMIGAGANALASSVVLVCRKRDLNATSISRRQFQKELREEMPNALEAMIGGTEGASPIAPVDLAQSAIGPGMAIFSKYDSILESDGNKMSVHDALILINRAITEYLNPDSGSFDSDTLFCNDWFNQYGWAEGAFGEADTLARAKGTSVDGVKDAGVVEAGGGKVRLLKWSEYPEGWNPQDDTRTPIWEACHQMIRVLNQQGETAAGSLLAKMPEFGEQIRQLAYHLYTLCERKKWAEEARAYNELIGSWNAIVTASHDVGHVGTQEQLGFDF